MARERLDRVLVERGLAESREKAQALILAGQVYVENQKADKPGKSIEQDAAIRVAGKLPYVSRGGLKLEAALDHFRIDPTGRVCMDVGSSTGGFADCLLQRGALRVHCVDTGRGQLHWKIRSDPRVVLHEGVNARYLEEGEIGEPVSLITCDVSFISATLVLPVVVRQLAPDGEVAVLVKPQFEVGRAEVGKGGIVTDPELHRMACDKVRNVLLDLRFFTEIIESPIVGAEGNREFLLYGKYTDRRHHLASGT